MLSLTCSCIEPRIVQFGKNPLSPFKVIRISGIDFTVPIIAQSKRLNLTPEIVAIFLCCFGWMCTSLNGVLLGRQSKSVPTHGMKDIKTLAPLVTANNICGSVTFGMPHMQSGTGRIRKHIETVKFGSRKIVYSFETLVVGPELLPSGFNLFEVIIHRS